MRVLHILPDIGVSNGVASVVLNYAKAMPDGIIFDIVYLLDTPETKKNDFEKLGCRVFKLKGSFPKNLFTYGFNSFFAEHKGEWNAVHIHIPYYSMFVVPGAKKAGIDRICCHCHSTWYSIQDKYDTFFKLLNTPTEKIVKQRFACGKDAGCFWYKKTFYVLNNALITKNYEYSLSIKENKRNELGIKNELLVGHVGRGTHDQKNHKFLFEVFSEILKLRSDSVLMLAGAQEDENMLSLCRKYNIEEHVRFLGFRNDIPELLNAFDVFVFPSLKEGLPVAVVEAQAASLPCLISENITDEVVIADNCLRMSLDESAETWAKKAIELSESERLSNYQLMKEHGWDIYDNAARLADYYKTGVFKDE